MYTSSYLLDHYRKREISIMYFVFVFSRPLIKTDLFNQLSFRKPAILMLTYTFTPSTLLDEMFVIFFVLYPFSEVIFGHFLKLNDENSNSKSNQNEVVLGKRPFKFSWEWLAEQVVCGKLVSWPVS